jgi:tRNA 5-methylaminomethyl-2-thiouridine biosynthesis bifunctional protein
MTYTPLVPAQLAFNDAGTPWSPIYADIYHSADGGLAQARHVFLGGNDLPRRWGGRECFTIFETGFGLGLNFLATWQAWRADPQRSTRLHFVSVEQHPFTRADLTRAHQAWPELAAQAAQLQAAWPPLTAGAHRLSLDDDQVTLSLYFGDATRLVRKLRVGADAIYLDGFAPAKNPAMWDANLLKAVSRLCAPGASLATWSVASDIRDALRAQRWTLEKRPGFGHKREMLCGQLHGSHQAKDSARRAVVVGAGLAGASIAERLATRDWQVTVLERHAGPAMETSGNPAGLLHPMLSIDDNIAARISRASYLYALALLQRLDAAGPGLRWKPCGVLQLARDAEQEAAQRRACAALDFPGDYVQFIDREAAVWLAGHPLAAGGWYYPGGAWISPPSLCQALLARHQGRIELRYGTALASLERNGDDWRLLADNGQLLAQAEVVVLANALDAQRLLPRAAVPLAALRGQLSFLPAGTLPFLRHAVCGNGYVTPDDPGFHCIGATYDFDDDDPLPHRRGHQVNVDRLAQLLPGFDGKSIDPGRLDGRAGFRAMTPDRLPLIGAVPQVPLALRREARLREVLRMPGLYALLGLGSRGLLWAPLAAELLAAQLNNEPPPLEGDLLDALDPARFLLRAHRRADL